MKKILIVALIFIGCKKEPVNNSYYKTTNNVKKTYIEYRNPNGGVFSVNGNKSENSKGNLIRVDGFDFTFVGNYLSFNTYELSTSDTLYFKAVKDDKVIRESKTTIIKGTSYVFNLYTNSFYFK